mmetsp:Transcript_59949/g.161615  ORF Transcript_59949/g.161615 Transcript_59949/m.161615 type:complete len:215 (+) Transcript_59949:3280-3924(+)
MPSDRPISVSTFVTAARTSSGLLGSSRWAVPLPPPPWMLLISPIALVLRAATLSMKPFTHASLMASSFRLTRSSSSESTSYGGVGAPTLVQMRLKPIFSSVTLATGSVPGHTRPSCSTARAASADSANADQPGMKTTSFCWRSECSLWSWEHIQFKRSAKCSMSPQDLGLTYSAPSVFGRRCLPSSSVWMTLILSPHTARMSAITEPVACLDWL